MSGYVEDKRLEANNLKMAEHLIKEREERKDRKKQGMGQLSSNLVDINSPIYSKP